ncbi:MAG: hypothetical protein QW367_00445 [Candidatus Aenigmatarchaeota archaeon]
MIKKIIEFFKKIIYIIKIAKKPTYSEIKKIIEFIFFLTIFIGIIGFIFYLFGLLFIS